MPLHRSLQSLLSAERFAERQARIEQDKQVRMAVQELLVRRALYSAFGCEVVRVDRSRRSDG